MAHNGNTKKGECIGDCCGGVEHENGGGRLRLLTSQQLAAVIGEQ